MGNLLRPKTSKCKVLKVFEFKMKFYVEITFWTDVNLCTWIMDISAFEQIISKLSFLSFSLAELGVFSFPSSSTEFSAA